MFGNLITNRQLRQLMQQKEIQIVPFDEGSLKTTHYTLHPGRVLGRQADGSWKQLHSFREDKHDFVIPADGYVLIEVLEAVKIANEGMVGRFIPTSNLIDGGLLLNAGQIDNKYGSMGEGLRFGIKNMLSVPNSLSANARLAHVEFFDLRGITVDPVPLSEEEKRRRILALVIAMDSGVNYGDGS